MVDCTWTEAEFYEERDRRTRQMGVLEQAMSTPIYISLGTEFADSRIAQVAMLGLVNMLARVHRSIVLSVPDAPLAAKPLVPATSLRSAIVKLVHAINPFLKLSLVEDSHARGMSVHADTGSVWYLGVDGACGLLAQGPQEIGAEDHAVLGAAMAACLGAACACRIVLGKPIVPARVSAWDATEGADASVGHTLGRIELGSVVMVGAGAVASALGYWARELDLVAKWTVIDKDDLLLLNTNRNMCSLAADAGWPNGQPTKKAESLSKVLGASPQVCWYDEWIGANLDERLDVILPLPLANGRHVRRMIGQRFEPIILHATTSSSWQAQLHRHIGGRDDCIECRMRPFESKEPIQVTCATGPAVAADGTSTDAALPFLSGAAGLLLAAALCRLGLGELTSVENYWALDFDTKNRITSCTQFECATECPAAIPMSVRREIARASRWATLLRTEHL